MKKVVLAVVMCCVVMSTEAMHLNPQEPIGLVYKGAEKIQLLSNLTGFRDNYNGPTDYYDLAMFSCIAAIIGTNGCDTQTGRHKLTEAIEAIRMGETVAVRYIPKWIDNEVWRKRTNMDCYGELTVWAPGDQTVGALIGGGIGGLCGAIAGPWGATFGGAIGAALGSKISNMSSNCIWSCKQYGTQLQ